MATPTKQYPILLEPELTSGWHFMDTSNNSLCRDLHKVAYQYARGMMTAEDFMFNVLRIVGNWMDMTWDDKGKEYKRN